MLPLAAMAPAAAARTVEVKRREVVEAWAEAPVLQTVQSAPKRIVQRDEIDTLPVLGRNFGETVADFLVVALRNARLFAEARRSGA